jgi:hypothetical protein
MMVVLSAMIVPNFLRQIQGDELPRSGKQFRSLITLVRAHAAFDAKRYRIRFPREEETDPLGGTNQPLVEREDDPIHEPDVFRLVTAPWAFGETFGGIVRCAEIRLGRPTIERLRELGTRAGEGVRGERERRKKRELFERERPPLYIEPDGSSEWATFVLTNAPPDVPLDQLESHPRVEVILDGATGLAWLQRPLYDEELDLFEDHNWPVVLRQDFLDPRVLTENDVLELREGQIQGREVRLEGRELKPRP